MKVKRQKLLLSIFGLVLLGGTTAVAMDHSMLIEGPFATGMEVTQTCLECHGDAAAEVMNTSHWHWNLEQEINGEKVARGKVNAINNFCVSIASNEPRCTSCHVGYGWEDDSFDFTDESRVDCLVCHDTTGTYSKTPAGAGMPDPQVDLLAVAQSVGKSSRQSCGACHFFGGGGDAVKHGDLDSSIIKPTRDIDVHMAVDGPDFSCTECHTTENHQISGHAMVVSPKGETHIGCVGCHDETPHNSPILNRHFNTVACQTCHIPTFAKDVATKTAWDWSTAGKDQPVRNDEHGRPVYDKRKGDFTWGKNIVPHYAWYNGAAGAYQLGDKIDPAQVTELNYPLGSRTDLASKIYPFKIHTAKQIYDSENMYLITPKVFGFKGDTEAYWVNFDWQAAAQAGMKASGLDYSGAYDFAPTVMYWRINHMVAPKEQALGCTDCHGKTSRLDWDQLGYGADPIRNRDLRRAKH
ncbi:MAG: tetrathionate reductase family octaheme c-type cytochrome [Pelovirga sp.]